MTKYKYPQGLFGYRRSTERSYGGPSVLCYEYNPYWKLLKPLRWTRCQAIYLIPKPLLVWALGTKLRPLASEWLLYHTNETFRLCSDCGGLISGQRCSYDGDYLDYCEGCGNVEQGTFEVSEEEYEAYYG